MAKLDPEAHEVNARILYWGIDGAGKQTSLRGVYQKLRPDHRGEISQVPTRFDPSAHYTVLPIELGEVSGTRTRIEIVSVPGSPEHAPTRKQLLDQVDGVVFVVDTQQDRLAENLSSLEELSKALEDYGRSLDEIPLVIQYNKCDLSSANAVEELHRRLALPGATVFESTATEGTGLLPALSTISKKVIRFLREQSRGQQRTPLAEAPPAATPSPSPAPAVSAAASPQSLEVDPSQPIMAAPRLEDPTRAELFDTMDPREAMEEAILAEAEHPDRAEAGARSEAAAWMLDADRWDEEPPADLEPSLGARITREMSIVSVGRATRADERSVRVPLVLGDEDGETSTLVLTVRLDPLVDESTS